MRSPPQPLVRLDAAAISRARWFCVLLASLAVVALAADSALAGFLYWSQGGPGGTAIKRKDTEGGPVETLLTDPLGRGFGGIALDESGGSLYSGNWDPPSPTLFRTNLDGIGKVDLVNTYVIDVELDLTHRKIYWGSAWYGHGGGALLRADLGGSNVQTLRTFGSYDHGGWGIALDPEAGKIYYSYAPYYGVNHQIRSMNLDGSGDALFRDLLRPWYDIPGDVEIDLTTRKLYWQEAGGGEYTQRIQRANLDGTGSVETLFEAPKRHGAYYGITLDVANQYLYQIQDASGLMQVYRMNTDGTDRQLFLSGDPGLTGCYIQYSVVPEPSSLAMICGVILVGGLLSVISRRRLRR